MGKYLAERPKRRRMMTNAKQSCLFGRLFINSRFFAPIFPFLESNWKFKLTTDVLDRAWVDIWPKDPKGKGGGRWRTLGNRVVSLCSPVTRRTVIPLLAREGVVTRTKQRVESSEYIYIFFSFHLACHFVPRVTRVECRLKRCNAVAQWTLYWKRRDILSAWKIEN